MGRFAATGTRPEARPTTRSGLVRTSRRRTQLAGRTVRAKPKLVLSVACPSIAERVPLLVPLLKQVQPREFRWGRQFLERFHYHCDFIHFLLIKR